MMPTCNIRPPTGRSKSTPTSIAASIHAISTDDIESVEIVLGIPSVEYGDLTSGLVKVKRREGGRDLTARFKADMSSKLFSVGKGFERKGG